MKPELTQARTCKNCGKALPIHLRADAMYCPPRMGEPRCSDITKARLIKQLEPWERKSVHEREVIQRQMPEGAVGYRISVVLNEGLYIFPKVGSRMHFNAYGQRVKSSCFTLSELARIPITALYKIEYVGSDGNVIGHGDRFLELTKTPFGRLQARPNPTARRVSAAILAGEPVTDSIRLHELASHLGISTVELFPILASCGVQARNHARATVSRADSAIVAAAVHKARGGVQAASTNGKPAAGVLPQPAPRQGPLFEQSPMIAMSTPALLEDEFVAIGRKIEQVEKDLAQATSASMEVLDEASERPMTIQQEADRLTGISFADGPFRADRARDDTHN